MTKEQALQELNDQFAKLKQAVATRLRDLEDSDEFAEAPTEIVLTPKKKGQP